MILVKELQVRSDKYVHFTTLTVVVFSFLPPMHSLVTENARTDPAGLLCFTLYASESTHSWCLMYWTEALVKQREPRKRSPTLSLEVEFKDGF